MGYTQKVVIVGAGISGLACAYRLRQLGIPCLVLEAQGQPGGAIASARRDGFLVELGPQCPRFPAAVWQMVKDLRLENEFVTGDPAVKRYIYRRGILHSAPFSPVGILTTPLIGLSTKLRLLAEPLRNTRPPEREETLAEFVTRKFGADFVDNLVDPVVSTIFFGDASRMGMESAFSDLVKWEREHGSLVRGAIRARNSKRESNGNGRSMKVTDALPSLGSFQSGMGRLPERLAEHLREQVHYGARVESVARVDELEHESTGAWQIRLAEGETITAEQVILSLPAYEAARVLEAGVPSLSRELQTLEYSAMTSVSIGYERGAVQNDLDGFGFMVPRKEGLSTICTFWNSSLFPGRAPEDKVLMTSFVRSDSAESSQDVLVRKVEAENAKILGISGEPVTRQVWSQPRALPQYNVGHNKRVAGIRELLTTLPTLHLAGNYLEGRSIGECVELAFAVAEELQGPAREAEVREVTRSSEE